MVVPMAPPLPPPLLPFRGVCKQRAIDCQCITKLEIARFWRQKRIEEEDHLLAAIKASAIIRARNLKDEDYEYFVMSLENENDEEEKGEQKSMKEISPRKTDRLIDEYKNSEVRVGIKDWWTKSNYAYLNQPAIECKEPPRRRLAASYIPNFLTYKPTVLCPTSINVF